MDLKLSESGETFDKGLFTKELEEALLRGESTSPFMLSRTYLPSFLPGLS
jgi:hypothetical protein